MSIRSCIGGPEVQSVGDRGVKVVLGWDCLLQSVGNFEAQAYHVLLFDNADHILQEGMSSRTPEEDDSHQGLNRDTGSEVAEGTCMYIAVEMRSSLNVPRPRLS